MHASTVFRILFWHYSPPMDIETTTIITVSFDRAWSVNMKQTTQIIWVGVPPRKVPVKYSENLQNSSFTNVPPLAPSTSYDSCDQLSDEWILFVFLFWWYFMVCIDLITNFNYSVHLTDQRIRLQHDWICSMIAADWIMQHDWILPAGAETVRNEFVFDKIIASTTWFQITNIRSIFDI